MVKKKMEVLVGDKLITDFMLTDYKKISDFYIHDADMAKRILRQLNVKQDRGSFEELLRYHMDKTDSLEECVNCIERHGFASVHNPELKIKVKDTIRFLRGEVYDFYNIHEGSEIYLNPKTKCKTKEVFLIWEGEGCARVTDKVRCVREHPNGSRFCEPVFPKKGQHLGDLLRMCSVSGSILVPNIHSEPIRYEMSICKNGDISWGCDIDESGQNKFWMEVRYYNDLLTVDSKRVNKIIYAWTEKDSHTKTIADWFETSFCRKQKFSWEKFGQELSVIGIDIYYPNLRIWFQDGTHIDGNQAEWND